MSDLYEQALEIERLLNTANGEISDITWDKHHPDYPESVCILMDYIARSHWVLGNYKDYPLKDVLGKIDTASIEEVKAAFTAIQRIERWVTGGWINQLEDRKLDLIVPRAIELSCPSEGVLSKIKKWLIN